jgi:hypothetical protein
MSYMVVWEDEQEIGRAWASGSDQELVEAWADLEMVAYHQRRPDVQWSRRRTYEFVGDPLAPGVAVLIDELVEA